MTEHEIEDNREWLAEVMYRRMLASASPDIREKRYPLTVAAIMRCGFTMTEAAEIIIDAVEWRV